MHNEADKLCIGIANPEKPSLEDFTRNLTEHPNKFVFSDYEDKPVLNRIFGTAVAIKEKEIEQPFVLLDCDSMLREPFKPDRDDHLIFHTAEPNKDLKSKIGKHISESLKGNHIQEETLPWIPMGDTICFNGIDERFFFRALEWGDRLHEEFGNSIDVDNAAWIMAAYDFIRVESIHNDFLEVTMMHHDIEAPFVHYEHGLPPDFIKRNFTYKKSLSFFSAGSPFDAILKNNPTSVTDYMQKVVRSYLEGGDLRHQDQEVATAS